MVSRLKNWLRGKVRALVNVPNDYFTWFGKTGSGQTVTADTALTFSAVYRATAIICQTLAGLPASVLKFSEEEVDKKPDHSVEWIFNLEFSPVWGSIVAREYLQKSVLFHGDGFAQIQWARNGTLLGLNVLSPDRVEPQWKEAGDGFVRVYVVDKKTLFFDDEILHIPGFGFDGLRGKSIITLAREAIGHGLALEAHGSKTFAGGTIPGYIKTARSLGDDVKAKMRESWKAVHKDANDVAVMDEDYEFKPLDLNNEDRQFLQSRSFQVVEIARWFGLPPHMLGELDKSNYNTTERLGDEFKSLTLQPWVNRWEQEATRKLLSRDSINEGFRVRFDMSELLRPDLTTRVNAHKTLVGSGIEAINEARRALGLPRSKDKRADELTIPLNMSQGNDQGKDETAADISEPSSSPTEGSGQSDN